MKKLQFIILVVLGTSMCGMKRPRQDLVPKPNEVKAQRAIANLPGDLSQVAQKHIDLMKQQTSNIKNMPDEIKAQFLIKLAQANYRGGTEEQKLYKAIESIRAFMTVFPQFYGDKQVNGDLVKELAKKYTHGQVIKVAVALATAGAGQWLKTYIGNDNNTITTLKYVLVDAAEYDQLGTIRFILTYIPEAAQQPVAENSAFVFAVQNGNPTIVELFLQVPGININQQDNAGITSLITAAYHGYAHIVERLLSMLCIDVNLPSKLGQTPLMVASAMGKADVVERLLKVSGIQVNTQSNTGDTALSIAAQNGHQVVVEQLLRVPEINVNTKNQEGNTALIFASVKGNLALVERLLREPGINVNLQNNQGDTALMFASENGHLAIVERLLDAGANVNRVQQYGSTALMNAVYHGYTNIVERLLKVPNILINARTINGSTALTLARELKSDSKDAIIRMLLAHGATE